MSCSPGAELEGLCREAALAALREDIEVRCEEPRTMTDPMLFLLCVHLSYCCWASRGQVAGTSAFRLIMIGLVCCHAGWQGATAVHGKHFAAALAGLRPSLTPAQLLKFSS